MKGLHTRIDRAGADANVAVVRLSGHIDTQTVAGLNETFKQLLKEPCHRIVIDLAEVTYISSAGWGVFIGEIRNIRDQRGDLKLVALAPEVEEVYRVLEFDSILKAYPSVEEALRDF